MLKFVFKKILTALAVIFTITTFTFFFINLFQGDPFVGDKTLETETLQNLQKMYGLDKSLLVRYWDFLKGILHLDFGYSYANLGIPIKDLIFPADRNSGFVISLKYCSIVFCLVLSFGILIGIFSAINNGIWDKIISFFTVLGFSIPTIILGPLLIQFFGEKLKWFPTCQWDLNFQHLFLPVLTLSISILCYISQVEKMNLFDVMNSPFIKMAQAKGLTRRQIIFKHALKPALLPVFGYLGSIISNILTGTVIIERLFGLPGIGNLIINAALARDYSMMLALIIIFSVIFISSHILGDILYVLIDPKVKFD
ncbi:MAG: ABC transporter permease [Cytophagales bacterium]|jgi:oligopeptide transport system permease protein|nr:ABC transporter permease [Cytophagales bacterium]